MVDEMLISRDFLKEYFKLHIKTAMEYKFNFVVQVIFMVLNNAAFTLFWIVIFSHLDEINGWILNDFLALFSLAAICYGVASLFLGNWRDLNEIVSEGKLDFYMVLPKDVLAHTLVSKSFFSAVGDVIFGIILFFLAVPFTLITIFYLILFTIGGALILVSLSVIMNCAAFWIGRSTQTSYAVLNLLLSMSVYPSVLYGPFIKTIFFFIIPIFFINNASIFILQEFSWAWMLGFIFMSLFMPVVAYIVFKLGLKKYESGNLVTVRV